MEMDALCIWAFRESECVWQTVNQPVMRGNRTVDRSISYFLRRQTEEKHHCSPGKWFAFHSSFISLILLVYLSFCFLPSPPFLPSVCLLQSLSTLNLAVWMFISAHFSSCPSHREGGGDPADQGWVMVYELSPVSDESSTWLDHLYRALQRTNICISKPSETLQGWTKCDYRHAYTTKLQEHFQTCYMLQVQALTTWSAKLNFSPASLFDESELETCDVTWMKTHALKKLSFLMFSCFLAAHSANVSSHQQLELVDVELLHVGHVLFCFLFFLCVY